MSEIKPHVNMHPNQTDLFTSHKRRRAMDQVKSHFFLTAESQVITSYLKHHYFC